MRTVHQYYDALVKGETPEVEEETAYIRAQKYYAQEAPVTEAFWREQKLGWGSANDIRCLLSHSYEAGTVGPARESFLSFSTKQTEQLKNLCRSQGVTINALLQFAWHKLLNVYSQDAQTIVGTIVSGRDIPVSGIESSVGMYINTLPLVVDWPEKASNVQVLQAIHTGIAELNSHSAIALSQLQSNGERLFQTLFVFENYPVSERDAPDAGIESTMRYRGSMEKTDYPLSVVAYERGDTLHLGIKYSDVWLLPAHADRLLAQLASVLEDVRIAPHAAHQDISLCDAAQQAQYLEWNSCSANYPYDSTLVREFERQVASTPERVALSFAGEELSYQALNQRANRLARALR
ncbi:condensation domain-containing protein, partial [Microbulbifer aggregans]|uniref:condensation domain-containing protein n=1 Tax=Microbulbifer aggregans TaxID=1769779 RepID=UPI0021F5A0A7